jgi:hypothetical protein
MTRKRFIKLLRSWRFSEKDIAQVVEAVRKHPENISYELAMKIINRYLIKELLGVVPEYKINYDFAPMKFIDTKETAWSDFRMMGLDVAVCNDTTTCVYVKGGN